MARHSTTLPLPSWFRSQRVLPYIGRDERSVHERVEDQRVLFALEIDGAGRIVEVEFGEDSAEVRLDEGELSPEVLELVRRRLGLVMDPSPFEARSQSEPEVARLVQGRSGLTIPQTGTALDGLVWVLCGQQVSLPVAFAIRRRLGRAFGRPIGDGLFTPPTAARLAGAGEDALRACGLSRPKASYLDELARAVDSGELELEALAQAPNTELEKRLIARRGLGPWSVNYLMMRAFGRIDCVPVGDVALHRQLATFHGLPKRPDAAEVQRLMAPFAPHRSLATFHLWSYEENAQ